MAVKKVGSFNIHETPAINQNEFDVETYLNANWEKTKEAVNNNAEELMQAQKDISTLKEDNKTNKSSIDVLEKSNETRDRKISKNAEDIEAIQGSIKTATETINKKDNEQDGKITLNKESIKEIQAENERLREDIKSIALQGEASGENIHLEDSSEARCEIEIDGNQKQDTREGYNLLDLSNFSTQTKNGVTATKNEDGSIKLVGTNSGDTFNFNLSTTNGEIGDYIASGVTGGSRETYFLAIVQPGVKTFAEVTNGSSNFSLTEEVTIATNIYIIKGATINTTIYPMMIKGTEQKPYEQYGASPSIDYPSKVKSVNGSAKIDIFNKNIFKEKTNKKDIKKAYNDIIGGILNIKKGEICIISFDTNNNQGGLYLNENIFSFQGDYSVTCDGKRHYLIGKAKDNINKNVTILKTNKETTNNYDISNVLVTKYDASNVDTRYIEHQEQSYLVDVQQEMLEGDTFVRQDGKWYEKHCWEKMLLNGTEKVGVSGASTNEILAIVYDINNAVDGFGYSNYFLYSSQVELNKISVYNGGKSLRINVSKMQFADLESFKAKVKELYEAGTPVIIYYKLAEPILLECTEAQSKVLDEIYNKAHTYKNITNILAESSEVNPIVNVKYLKDTETEHKKLQAQIDEIKELLSSTETSALLVNNLEKDLRMEVE